MDSQIGCDPQTAALLARVEKLEVALKFYAMDSRYYPYTSTGGPLPPILHDKGEKARDALETR